MCLECDLVRKTGEQRDGHARVHPEQGHAHDLRARIAHREHGPLPGLHAVWLCVRHMFDLWRTKSAEDTCGRSYCASSRREKPFTALIPTCVFRDLRP